MNDDKLETAILEILGENRAKNSRIRYKLQKRGFEIGPHKLGSILRRMKDDGRVCVNLRGGGMTWRLSK